MSEDKVPIPDRSFERTLLGEPRSHLGAEATMTSVRRQLLERFPIQVPETEPDGDVATAVYALLGSMEGLVVDGWTLFRIVQESTDFLEALGLMTLLPSGSTPISVKIRAVGRGLTWSAQVGIQDEQWLALSDPKRWNSVYLYAAGGREGPQWNWGREYQDMVRPADD